MKLKRSIQQISTNPVKQTNKSVKINNNNNAPAHIIKPTSKVSDDIDDIFASANKPFIDRQSLNDCTSDTSDNDELNSEDERIVDAADELDDEQVTKLIEQKVKSAKNKHSQSTRITLSQSTAPIDDLGFTRYSTAKTNTRGYTDDGYKIYTSDELKVALPNSGNTSQCPFDCQCCF